MDHNCSHFRILLLEDHRQWWKIVFASGSSGFYVFLYSLSFLLNDLPDKLNDFVSILIYMAYSILLAITVMFATRSIGLLPSFLLVHHVFTVKVKFLETSTETNSLLFT